MNKILNREGNIFFYIAKPFCLVLTFAITQCITAQDKRASPGEAAVCEVRVNNTVMQNSLTNKGAVSKKMYRVQPNQIGFFDRVSNIKPLEIVPITISYPEGRVGEKILLSAEDGGKFENGKRIMVSQLDNQKKLVFNFKVSDQEGIFRISLRKGNDVKVVQLWVDSQSSSLNQK